MFKYDYKYAVLLDKLRHLVFNYKTYFNKDTHRLKFSSLPYSPQSLRTVLYGMQPVHGNIIRAQKRTCIRNSIALKK